MDETGSQKDAALSLSDGGPLRQARDPGGLESEGLNLRSGSILRGRSPHTSQMSDSQALTEFGMVTAPGQTVLRQSESETVKPHIQSVQRRRTFQYRIVLRYIRRQSINQFFNYRNVKTHLYMRKTQNSKIYVKSVNTYLENR